MGVGSWAGGPCTGSCSSACCGGALWQLSSVGARTGSPMTWLSTCRVRLMPMMPKTTKTMAPVSTSGRTAGFPQPVFMQGLKPKVAERRALGAAEGGTAIQKGQAQPPEAPQQPPCTYLARWARRRTLWSAHRAGAEQAARRCHTHTPVERGLVGLGKIQLPVEAKEAGTEDGRARRARRGWEGEAKACRGQKNNPGIKPASLTSPALAGSLP